MMLHQQMSAARVQAHHAEAQRARRLTVLRAARRAAARAASAERRARLASDAATYAALRVAEAV